MIELVPGNNTRVRVKAVRENADTGKVEPAAGLAIIVRVAASRTATAAIGTLSYSATELAQKPGDYTATILGADVTSQLEAAYMNTKVVIQVISGSTISGYLDAIVRPVRSL